MAALTKHIPFPADIPEKDKTMLEEVAKSLLQRCLPECPRWKILYEPGQTYVLRFVLPASFKVFASHLKLTAIPTAKCWCEYSAEKKSIVLCCKISKKRRRDRD